MPIGIGKAPKALPQSARRLWVDTFNGVFEDCNGSETECDAKAGRTAWDQVKGKYRKMGNQWVLKETEKSEAYIGTSLIITKASLGADGSMRWQAVTSDTDEDKATERTSLALFRDWVERVNYGIVTSYLPNETRMPFLGLSHYPAFDDGSGAAGSTAKMFTDGDQFKACGLFYSDEAHPIGPALFEAVRKERALVRKGTAIDNPIRISAGWWDLQHSHGEFVFTRRNLTDVCPMCVKGVGGKVYLKGQLDHFAATRVPMNPRTNLELQEKSMAVTTRKEDAASIIDDMDLVEDTDRKARLIGKAETDELHPAMVVRAKDKDDEEDEDAPPDDEATEDKDKDKGGFGAFLKNQRKKKKMALAQLGKAAKIDDEDLEDFETNKRRPGKRMIDAIGEALELEDEELEEMAGFFSKDGKNKKAPPFKKGNKAGKKKSEVEDVAEVERNGMEAAEVAPMRPLGGAVSVVEAEGFLDAQEKLSNMHSNWDVFRTVIGNILTAPSEEVPNKARAMSQAINQFGSRIDSLKASLADAYMLQNLADHDEPEDQEYDEVYEYDEVDEDQDQETETEIADLTGRSETMSNVPDAILAVEAARVDKSLSMAQKNEAIQNALNTYTTEINDQLTQDDPARQANAIADAVAQAVKSAMGPIHESLGLMNAKLGEQAAVTPQNQMVPVALPEQKSYIPGQAPQPVGPQPGELPVSSVTGEKSKIRAVVDKSMLSVANGVNY